MAITKTSVAKAIQTFKEVAVYIGRFNPFHLGHAYVLKQALETSKLVIVLVGSSFQARTPKNPFTFAERKEMIESWHRSAMHKGADSVLLILPVRDFASNNMWVKSVQESVRSATKNFCLQTNTNPTDVHLTGSDRDDSTWYLNAFPQWKQDLVPPKGHAPGRPGDLSASSVREVLYTSNLDENDIESLDQKLPFATRQFIRRFIDEKPAELARLRSEYKFIKNGKKRWATAPYPVNFNTADAVVIQSGHVLVVRRANEPGRGLIALPGGYVNVNERIKDGAIREAMEETGLLLTTGKNAEEVTKRMLRGSIRGFEIFDEPGRSERGRIITVAYLMRLDDERPLPKVKGQNVPFYEANGKEELETLEAFWLPLDKAFDTPELWFEDHLQILEHFVTRLDA